MDITELDRLMHLPKFSVSVTDTGDYNYSHCAKLTEDKTDQNNMDILNSAFISRRRHQSTGYISSAQIKGDAALMLPCPTGTGWLSLQSIKHKKTPKKPKKKQKNIKQTI